MYHSLIISVSVFAVDYRHVTSCDFRGGVAKIVCVTLATLTNRNFLLTVCTIHINKIMTQTEGGKDLPVNINYKLLKCVFSSLILRKKRFLR